MEDNAGDITLLRTALRRKRLDGDLTVFRDGEAAMKFADAIEAQPNAACPRLAILDLNLPKVNGRDVLKRFRESARLGAIPIVILSSSSDERDKIATLDLGATCYLQKPLNLAEFMEIGTAIEALLRESGD